MANQKTFDALAGSGMSPMGMFAVLTNPAMSNAVDRQVNGGTPEQAVAGTHRSTLPDDGLGRVNKGGRG